MREPIVSGMFYPSDREELKKQIKESYSSKLGPDTKDNFKVFGAICPHAGYQFSGQCAAHCYNQIKNQKYDTFIILGTNHTGTGESSVSLENFNTPLGTAKNDTELTKAIMEKCNLKENKQAHSQEHSIEVQLPFLQDIFNEINIVPIIIDFGADYKRIAKGLSDIIKNSDKKICVIASSDFTHCGMNYGFMPFTENIKEKLEEFDFKAILKVLAFDSEGFLNYVQETGATICGAYAIATLIEVCKSVGKKETKLLKYYTSGDITRDYSSAVGYASIIIKD
ncbi:AmmeMemoRadiSam system protein B [Candidatus Woesearchaeota archaeon]|nr:AmmeMemoRadiSam system protein B [Candidatus Woesearchaeota archaeon]